MNAELTIKTSKRTLMTKLNNVQIEQFPDGTMIHADNGFVFNIQSEDIVSVDNKAIENIFTMTDGSVMVIKWLD